MRIILNTLDNKEAELQRFIRNVPKKKPGRKPKIEKPQETTPQDYISIKTENTELEFDSKELAYAVNAMLWAKD